MRARAPLIALAAALCLAAPAFAQHEHHGHAAPDTTARTRPRSASRPSPAARPRPGGTPRTAPHAAHPAEPAPAVMHHHVHEGHVMPALLGPYPMTREASGTAWQPDASPHAGFHLMRGPWSVMVHGFLDVVADFQGGPRGEERPFAASMLMGMATRPLGPGRLGLRLMLSVEPWTIGDRGYPLLLQTGETADGRTHLIDAQHPHDLFMEMAGTFSVSDASRSAFVYAGLPGEPALGPPAFMHRFSGASIPESPITHHWLDSSHITFGVLTGGATWEALKVEASAFRGREPDQRREDIERPKLDSHSFRLSWNPNRDWSLQASHGRLESPEQLEPDVNLDRTTVSMTHHRAFRGGPWQTTLAWGRNDRRPGPILDAWLLESTAAWDDRHTLEGRAEWAEKDELFDESDPRAGRVFEVGKVAAGYAFDAFRTERLVGGPGLTASLALVPRSLEPVYGTAPFSAMVYFRVVLR